jgi:hypothetical protein
MTQADPCNMNVYMTFKDFKKLRYMNDICKSMVFENLLHKHTYDKQNTKI